VVGKHSGSSIYDCAPQLCHRHRAKRVNQWKGDLARRRLRAYEPDGLDGSVLWSWAYTYTHANGYSYSHSYSYSHVYAEAIANGTAWTIVEAPSHASAKAVTPDSVACHARRSPRRPKASDG